MTDIVWILGALLVFITLAGIVYFAFISKPAMSDFVPNQPKQEGAAS